MTKPLLVLVHGRAQGGRSEEELLGEWTGTLKRGLRPDQAARLSEAEIRLPFYGDQLDDLVANAAPPPGIATRGSATDLDADYAAFMLDFVEEIRAREGLTDARVGADVLADRGPMQWRWVQRVMQTLEVIPGLSAAMIELVTRDVWVYLTNPHVRATINAIVADALEAGRPTVIVGHSLGSVVAYDVISKTQGLSVPLYLTVGSPLGVKSVKDKLAPIARPAIIGDWFNAFDDRDVVALNPLDGGHFPVAPPIENYDRVRNRTSNAHGISGYLNDTKVASKLFGRLFR